MVKPAAGRSGGVSVRRGRRYCRGPLRRETLRRRRRGGEVGEIGRIVVITLVQWRGVGRGRKRRLLVVLVLLVV